MIHTKKWMVVPFESDDEEHFCDNKYAKTSLNERKLDESKNEHENEHEKKPVESEMDNVKDEKDSDSEEEINEKEEKKEHQKKHILDELKKMTESYYKRNPSANTRSQNFKRLQNKRKHDRSTILNQSRFNTTKLQDQSVIQSKKKIKVDNITLRKDNKKLSKEATKIYNAFGNLIRFSRLNDDDIEMDTNDHINKDNIDFGDISVIKNDK